MSFKEALNLRAWRENPRPATSRHGLSGDDAVTQSSSGDYIPQRGPFQYYLQTANPHHTGPSGTQLIGTSNDGDHQYDLIDFSRL
jgi:phospholipase C